MLFGMFMDVADNWVIDMLMKSKYMLKLTCRFLILNIFNVSMKCLEFFIYDIASSAATVTEVFVLVFMS